MDTQKNVQEIMAQRFDRLIHPSELSPLLVTRQWALDTKPNPSGKDVCVQLGVVFEEISELVKPLFGAEHPLKIALHEMAEKLQGGEITFNDLSGVTGDEERKETTDACADILVTIQMFCDMLRIDLPLALAEVNLSNNSKFVDGKPIYKPSGKVDKGPDYKGPELDEAASKEAYIKNVLEDNK